MGCDIHSFAEVRRNNKWEIVKEHFSLDEFNRKYYNKEKGDNPFDWRSYSMFGFLAGVRNYSCCEPISESKGIPEDVCEEIKEEYERWDSDAHSASYLTLRELIEFDYNQILWDRRITREESPNCFNGAALANEGEGKMITYREHLGESFFKHLEELNQLGELDDVRIVFWFDN